jgi:predicted nucleic acid-binding protein
MRVLLDTDVVLDILLKREPWQTEIAALRSSRESAAIEFAITSLTVANAFYVCRKQTGSNRALSSVKYLLETFLIFPVDFATPSAAAEFPGTDFEDNVQIAAALANTADSVVTRDRAGFSQSPIPVYSAVELLASLREKSEPK